MVKSSEASRKYVRLVVREDPTIPMLGERIAQDAFEAGCLHGLKMASESVISLTRETIKIRDKKKK